MGQEALSAGGLTWGLLRTATETAQQLKRSAGVPFHAKGRGLLRKMDTTSKPDGRPCCCQMGEATRERRLSLLDKSLCCLPCRRARTPSRPELLWGSVQCSVAAGRHCPPPGSLWGRTGPQMRDRCAQQHRATPLAPAPCI